MSISLKELADAIGAEVVGGDPATPISAVNTLEDAGPGEVSFLSNARYVRLLETTRASAVIVVAGPNITWPMSALCSGCASRCSASSGARERGRLPGVPP